MRKNENPKLSNSIYIPEQIRIQLEELTIETSFHRKRQISKSKFVQYLIEQFGEQAKCQLISESHNHSDTEN